MSINWNVEAACKEIEHVIARMHPGTPGFREATRIKNLLSHADTLNPSTVIIQIFNTGKEPSDTAFFIVGILLAED